MEDGMIENPRRLRSRLHYELMALLVGHVAVPILVAELHEFARRSQSVGAALSDRRSMLYHYLHRLADHGWVRIQRVHDRLAVLLTAEGEKELERFRRRGGAAGHSLVPSVREARDPDPATWRRAFVRAGGGVRKTQAFVSYDVPADAQTLRYWIARALGAAGFSRLHESMWIGDPRRLPAVVALAEQRELLPHLKWGAIQVFSGTDPKGRAPRVPGGFDGPRDAPRGPSSGRRP